MAKAITRQYDGDLAVATIALNLILAATQIGFVADGLMMISGQSKFLSALFAIVIATGLLHSQFVSHRLWAKLLPRRYAWCFAGLTASITGLMAVIAMTQLAQPWTPKWYFGAFLGILVPLQTMFLANMTSELFLLAGINWFTGSYCETIVAVVFPRPAPPLSHPLRETKIEETQSSDSKEELLTPIFSPVTTPAPSSIETTGPEQLLAPPSTIFFSDTTLSLHGEWVVIRVKGDLSKRRWKELHSELRRTASINWGDATRAKHQDGRSERVLEGRIVFPKSTGKKNKKKRENSRAQHLEEILQQIKVVVSRHN